MSISSQPFSKSVGARNALLRAATYNLAEVYSRLAAMTQRQSRTTGQSLQLRNKSGQVSLRRSAPEDLSISPYNRSIHDAEPYLLVIGGWHSISDSRPAD